MQNEQPIKVLQIGMTHNWGGLETYLMQQYNNIDKSKVTYDFVNITSEKEIVFSDEIRNNGSEIFQTCSRHKNPMKHYWQWINILRTHGKEYRAIVLNSNSLEYVFPIFIAMFFGIPIRVIHSHNAGFERKIGFVRKLLIRFNKILLKLSATNYFACSQKAGEWMFDKDTKFDIIHNAIAVENFVFNKEIRIALRRELNIENSFILGHVGRFTYQKNHEFLIRVFNEILKRKSNAKLMLIGDFSGDDSYWNSAKKLVKELGIEGKVLFLGLRKDVPQLMQAMDCFILPSKFEGLGIVGIEAQASGLPCFFANTITEELGITDLAHYISLHETPKVWAERVCGDAVVERVDMSEQVKKAGYDIKEEIRKIEEFYLKGK